MDNFLLIIHCFLVSQSLIPFSGYFENGRSYNMDYEYDADNMLSVDVEFRANFLETWLFENVNVDTKYVKVSAC